MTPIYLRSITMLKDKLLVANQITRKSSPWIGIATMLIIAVNDLKKS